MAVTTAKKLDALSLMMDLAADLSRVFDRAKDWNDHLTAMGFHAAGADAITDATVLATDAGGNPKTPGLQHLSAALIVDFRTMLAALNTAMTTHRDTLRRVAAVGSLVNRRG